MSSRPKDLPFSFGGFAFSWLFLFFHGKPRDGATVLLLFFICNLTWVVGFERGFVGALVQLGIALLYGQLGSEIAWDHHRCQSIEGLRSAEYGWSVVGKIATTIGLFIPILFIIGAFSFGAWTTLFGSVSPFYGITSPGGSIMARLAALTSAAGSMALFFYTARAMFRGLRRN